MQAPVITTLPERRSGEERLQVNDLWKGFRSPQGEPIAVLRGASFTVFAGEVVAITGASGAGKSTLLHILGGLEAPDRGAIQLFRPGMEDQDFHLATQGSISPAASMPAGRVGFIFQFHHLLPDLNALENVAVPLMIARCGRIESKRRATLCLQQMGLGPRLTQRIVDLSGGEQQRVAVARALVARPSLVLADEPTGNLDAASGEEIGQMLIDYCRQHQAIVVIATHNERLAQICDRVLWLREGKF